jgi:hypothetical protein
MLTLELALIKYLNCNHTIPCHNATEMRLTLIETERTLQNDNSNKDSMFVSWQESSESVRRPPSTPQMDRARLTMMNKKDSRETESKKNKYQPR